MAYPTLPIDRSESRRIPRDGREEDVIGDGLARVRKTHTTRYDFEIKHPMLNSTDFSTWQTHYNANENALAFDLVWPEDGATYSVRYGKNAFRTQFVKPGRRHVWVRLVAAG